MKRIALFYSDLAVGGTSDKEYHAEMNGLGWTRKPIVLELDNGTVLYPSSDDEGNEAGSLFGNTKNNEQDLTFPVL